MEFNEYKQIKNKRYSPKEVLAHFIISNGDVVNKEFKSMVASLENTFIKNINNKTILEKVDITLLKKIENYWSLSIGQAMAYGMIVFYNLGFENKEFNEKEITDMFVYVMRLYSPSNAVEFVREKFKKISYINNK